MIFTEYRAKTLFKGYNIGLENGKLYVGVPNIKGENVRVYYQSQKMTIRDYDGFVAWSKWMPDKTFQNNGEPYRLAYFEWMPDGTPKQEPKPVPEEPEVKKIKQPKLF